MEFLADPVSDGTGELYTEALVNDLFRHLAKNPTAPQSVHFSDYSLSMESQRLVAIAVWLLCLPCFEKVHEEFVKAFLFRILPGVSPHVESEKWIEDEERAEELARIALNTFDMLPENETAEEAQDRLEAVDTVKRIRVIKESQAAFERAQEIRRQMAEKRAREAANVYSRE